jgi:hypothetical protein
MDVRILDLDRSMIGPCDMADEVQVVPLRHWGPKLRLGCSFARFRDYEAELVAWPGPTDTGSLCLLG